MAKMKLYYSPASPYARKVRAVAIETGLDKKLDMVNVTLTPVAPNADVDKHNPIGKIPALSVKGMDLFDSPVICEYLDNQHKRRKLLRSEEHTSELQSLTNLVCRLLLEKKKHTTTQTALHSNGH